jgi:hypothetical protein
MTRSLPSVFPVTIFILVSFCTSLSAQPWTFAREKDGISVYTSQKENSSFKSFYGEVDFRGDFERVSALLGDPTNNSWWAEDVRNIQVLSFEKDQQISYYFEYHLPWPLTNRDLVSTVQIKQDSVTGIKTLFTTPLLNIVPQRTDMVRITEYWERWTIQPLDSGMIHLTLEGYIDPGGDVPAWLYNIVVVDIPLKLLQRVREQAIVPSGEEAR